MSEAVSMNRVFVLLGSNIDKQRNLPAAAALLRTHGLVRVSPVYETEPVGAVDTASFLNAAAEIVTALDPQAFKREVCDSVERALGRVRVPGDRFAPRTIDVDIALWNDEVIDTPGLRVPDPNILRHLHVALPLSDLAPDLCHPIDGRNLATIVRDLAAQGAPVAAARFPCRRPDVIMLFGS